MGCQSIVSGRIVLGNYPEKAREVIAALGNGRSILTTEMFGLGISQRTYYEDPVLSFGATYKQIEDYWSDFIVAFEEILRQIDFDTAKILLETGIYGDYNFFWKSKRNGRNRNFREKDEIIETEEWYFGFGNRTRDGHLVPPYTFEAQVFDWEGFKYPVEIPPKP
jgi:hypothetical protein